MRAALLPDVASQSLFGVSMKEKKETLSEKISRLEKLLGQKEQTIDLQNALRCFVHALE